MSLKSTSEAAGNTDSRRSFLRHSALVTAAAVPALAATGVFVNTASAGQASARGRNRNDFRDIQTHENEHVDFLVGALGSAARPKPTFQGLEQGSFKEFLKISQALENTGVGAYLGAAPFIKLPAYLAAAGSIALIEARHAGFLNALQEDLITQNVFGNAPSFEVPLTAGEVVGLAGPFIAHLNGGPLVGYEEARSDTNDIAILNFALALEYLEAEFYNINVPKFFGRRGRGR